MSTRDPQPRERVRSQLGPIRLPAGLDQPTVSSDGDARLHNHEAVGEQTIVQNLGPTATQYSVSGECFRQQALVIPALVRGGPFKFTHDSLPGADGSRWVFCKSLSVAPAGWRAARGQWAYRYDLDLLADTNPPENGRSANPVPIDRHATSTTMQPPTRTRTPGSIGPIDLHPDIDKPKVAIDATARVRQHDPVGSPTVVRWLGYDALEITIEGPCFRRHLPQLRSLTRGDRIDVTTDHYDGAAAVKSVATNDEQIRYESGQWGRQYTLELLETLE